MSISDNSQKIILRKDIQALRAIAIASVVLFHFWPQLVSGGFVGVDVFFVISGFLITSHILREIGKGSFKISLFWVRRVRRLLPASLTVLAITGISVVALVPVQLWLQWLKEIQASILYIENWVLALDSVDYLAQSNEPSPAQHFWSLSVEEQFYMVWPILIASSTLLVRRRSAKTKRVAIFGMVLFVTLISFAYGVCLTQTEPSIAYFSTPVRAWEFGVGALIAFAPSVKQLVAARVTTIAGLAIVVYSSYTYSTSLIFPGLWALLPVLGTALIIWGASNEGVLGRVFGLRALQWLGERSYSIYLWHWPIVILLPYVLGADLNALTSILALTMTLLLASITTAKIERPFLAGGSVPKYKPSTVFGSLLIVSSLIVASLAVGIEQAKSAIASEKKNTDEIAKEELDCFGAAARAPGKEPCSNPNLIGMFPPLSAASADLYVPDECELTKNADYQPVACQVGVATSKVRIALIGDSHAIQYIAALENIAQKNSWSVEVFAKGGCQFNFATRVLENKVLRGACNSYIKNLARTLLNGNYDLVITSQKSGVDWVTPVGESEEETAVKGLKQAWSSLTGEGIPILAIKDNPVPVPDVIRCLELKAADLCQSKRSEAFPADPQVEAASRLGSKLINLVSFDEIFCNPSFCPPVIGNVVVYRDGHHLTSTFSRTLSQYLEPNIKAALAG